MLLIPATKQLFHLPTDTAQCLPCLQLVMKNCTICPTSKAQKYHNKENELVI